MCRGFTFFLCKVVLSRARYCFVVTFLMFARLTTAGNDNTTESQNTSIPWNYNSKLIQCRMKDGKPVCHSPYLIATIFIFLFLFIVITGQCAIILYQSRTRYRRRKAAVGTDSNDDGLYSDINRAEFISSLSGKLERNDSIGSSSLNFLSPGGCTSTKSLSNLSSISDGAGVTDPPKRHDTVVYSEINSKRHTVDCTSGIKESVSSYVSRESQHYDFIKSLSLEGEKKARSSTYCEIPIGKNGILRQTKIEEDYEGNEPLNVKAEVHTFPTDERDDLDSDVTKTEEENRRDSHERPATYIDVFADEDDYKEYIASMGKRSPDEKDGETAIDDVTVTNTLEEYVVRTRDTRDRIPTYLSIKDENAGLEDCPTLNQVNCSEERAQWRDSKNSDYRMLGTTGPLLHQSESDVKVCLYPGIVQLSDTGGPCIDSSKGQDKMFGESVPMVSLVK